jgi:hypothetical protein
MPHRFPPPGCLAAVSDGATAKGSAQSQNNNLNPDFQLGGDRAGVGAEIA